MMGRLIFCQLYFIAKVNKMSVIVQKQACLWHPCSQMKDYEDFPPLDVARAHGSYLFLTDNRPVIDAISSWWCKSLGHGHQRLKSALLQQLEKFEHVILANTINDTIHTLSVLLCGLTQQLSKVMYASDGSCAIEIAMKMSLHAHQIQGKSQRTRFICLKNGYHGETSGALSVSDVGCYRQPYQNLLFDPVVIQSIPYVSSQNDPLWHDCSSMWPAANMQLEAYRETATALILEPILQGAGGMLIYSQDFLRRLRVWCRENGVNLIADEVMTGLGRTGLPLACQHASIEPDFLCLSKGLTSGWLPLSAVCTTDAIYDVFYDDYESNKAFLHSHTHTGNALAASVAIACIKTLAEENIYQHVQKMEKQMANMMQEIGKRTQKLTNIRHIGGMVAADLIVPENLRRAGYAVYRKAVALGALLRPLGNTIYWLPPLNTDENTLAKLQNITEQAIREVL